MSNDLYLGTRVADPTLQTQGTDGSSSTIPGSSAGAVQDTSSSLQGSPPPVPSFSNTPLLASPNLLLSARTGTISSSSSFNSSATQVGDIFLGNTLSSVSGTGIDTQAIKNGANDPLGTIQAILTNPNAPINQAAMNLAQKSVSQQQEILASLQTIAIAMPDSTFKQALLNFLSVVGQAINQLSQALAELQMNNNETSRQSALAKMDAANAQYTNSMQQLKIQEQQQQAQAKASNKSALDWISFAFNVLFQLIAAVVVTIFVPVVGALAAAALIANVVDSIMKAAGNQNGVWGAMFQAIASIPDPGLRTFLQIAATGVLLSALTLSGSVLLGGGDAFTNILLASGLVPPDQQAAVSIALAVTFAVLQLATAIVCLVVPGAQEAVLGMIAKVSELAQKIVNIVSTTSKSINMIKLVSEGVVTALNASATIADTVKNAQLYKLMSALSNQLGDLESSSEQITVLLSLLKKLIAALTSGNSDISQFLGILQQFQQDKYQLASNAASGAFQG